MEKSFSKQRTNKMHKTSLQKKSAQKTYNDLMSKGKKAIRNQRNSKKKKKKNIGVLKKLNELEVKEEKNTKISKFSLGQIKYAEIHRQATKPLKQLKELTKEEIKKYSCPCCGLPSEITGKLEPYKISDNPDEFVNCGQGVVLYFSYFKFAIAFTFIATIGISFIDSYIAYNYSYELREFCDNLYDKFQSWTLSLQPEESNISEFEGKNNSFLKSFNGTIISLEEECKFYSNKSSSYNSLYNSFFYKVSLINVYNYRQLYYNMNQLSKNYNIESTIINFSFNNFICMIINFLFYLIFICFLFNKSKVADCRTCTVNDYAIIITNLQDIYEQFINDLEYINNCNNQIHKQMYINKLGFNPDKNMPQLDLFKIFLERRILKNKAYYYNINRIDLCYKLDEIIKLQKKSEELEEKNKK